MLSLAWIMVLLHFQVDPWLYVIPKRALWELEAHNIYYLLSRWPHWTGTDKLANTYLPQRQATRIPHALLRIPGSPRYPHYDMVDHRR